MRAGSFGVPERSYPRTAFNALRLWANQQKSIALAAPAARIRPWVNYKSYCLDCSATDYYEEKLFHFALVRRHSLIFIVIY
jgi:hypothetical protein